MWCTSNKCVMEKRRLLAWWFLFLNQTIIVFAAREPPTVTIPGQGQLMGMYMKMFRIQRIVAYLGIPYAHPPIYEKRFGPPVVDNLPSWDGIRNATELQSECWSDYRKPIKKHDEAFMRLIGTPKKRNVSLYNEDCLYLNIYLPEGKFNLICGFLFIILLHFDFFLIKSHLIYKEHQILNLITIPYFKKKRFLIQGF